MSNSNVFMERDGAIVPFYTKWSNIFLIYLLHLIYGFWLINESVKAFLHGL